MYVCIYGRRWGAQVPKMYVTRCVNKWIHEGMCEATCAMNKRMQRAFEYTYTHTHSYVYNGMQLIGLAHKCLQYKIYLLNLINEKSSSAHRIHTRAYSPHFQLRGWRRCWVATLICGCMKLLSTVLEMSRMLWQTTQLISWKSGELSN